jgi:hypothetical protein
MASSLGAPTHAPAPPDSPGVAPCLPFHARSPLLLLARDDKLADGLGGIHDGGHGAVTEGVLLSKGGVLGANGRGGNIVEAWGEACTGRGVHRAARSTAPPPPLDFTTRPRVSESEATPSHSPHPRVLGCGGYQER